MSKKILIMAGGTGGHIFPALAIAKELESKGAIIEWLGGIKGMESTLVAKYGYRFNGVYTSGLRGKNPTTLFKAIFLLSFGFIQTILIFIRFRPHKVIGMGGYASGVGGIVSKIFFTSLVIHEQNTIPGTTNKVLSRIAQKCFQAFDNTFHEDINAITTGNPILFTPNSKSTPNSIKNILILGGSLGAKKINQTIPTIKTPLNIWHQTGEKHLMEVKALYTDSIHSDVKIEAFIDNMAEAYVWADLVISRAGAMTVSELIASKTIAILVPFPYAIDNHQTVNAEHLSKNGAGIIIQESSFSGEIIDKELLALDSIKIHEMTKKLELLSVPNSEKIIADYLLC
jgi:UDP-N-acetylglucosamine--N-acetylmuramyl-(pentapeptide) pyrophosphoryl-undecaprenol N-acetylglucosamine transferase